MPIFTVPWLRRAYAASALVAAGCAGTSQVELPAEAVTAPGVRADDDAAVPSQGSLDGGGNFADASGLPAEPVAASGVLLRDAAAAGSMRDGWVQRGGDDAAIARDAPAERAPLTQMDATNGSVRDPGRVDASVIDPGRVDASVRDPGRVDASVIDSAAHHFLSDGAADDPRDGGSEASTRSPSPDVVGEEFEAATPFFSGGYLQSGPWMGWAYTTLDDRGSTVSRACTASGCTPGWGNQACVVGTVAEDDDSASYVGLGFEVNHPRGGDAGSWSVSGTGLSVSITNAPPTTRVTLEEPDAEGQDERYCAPVPAGGAGVIPWSSFKTRCWGDATRASVTLTPGTRIASVTIAVPGSNAATQPVDFCVVSLLPQ